MKHCNGLDGLRGIAVIMVVAVHAYYLGPQFQTAEGFYVEWLRQLLTSGWIGVDLFFALSGFLITSIQIEEKSRNYSFKTYLKRFYVKRGLRIFPLYYGLLAACVVGSFLSIHSKIDPALDSAFANFGIYALFLSNYIEPILGHAPESSHLLGMTWSLATEEQYYLIWPIVLFAIPLLKLRSVTIGLLIALPIIRIAFLLGGASSDFIYSSSITHIDSILMGSLLAISVNQSQQYFSRWWMIALGGILTTLGLLAAGTIHYSAAPIQILGYTGIALISASFIEVIWRGGTLSKIFEWRPFVVFGKYSYFIYLFHILLMVALSSLRMELGSWGIPALLVYFSATCLISLGLGALSFRCVESKFMALRQRWI
jgi:peptidoglycan/LPS O-acetylase OafA/YrhL